jgi:hypothetical protein
MRSLCAGLESAVEFPAKAVYVFDAVGHVFTILPHAGEGRIANRSRSLGGRFYRHMHLDNRAFFDRRYTP